MSSSHEPARWYAVAVKARQEKAAADDLTRRGLDVFLPLRIERRMWSDRVKNVQLALFPGYLFVRAVMSAQKRIEILRAINTVDLVGRLPGSGRIAQPVPDDEIASLQTLVTSGRHLDPATQLVAGTPVLVAAGALKGARGVVEKAADGSRRLVVQIEILGRGVRTQLTADDVVQEAPP